MRKVHHDLTASGGFPDAANVVDQVAASNVPTINSITDTAQTLSAATLAATADVKAAAAEEAKGYPGAANTGVPAGTVLTKFYGTYYVTEDNAKISNLEIHGNIIVEAKNVTMTNIKLISETPWHAIRVMDDATGFTLQDSEIDGSGADNGILGQGTFLRNDIYNVENGINVTGPSMIRDNFIHDLYGSEDAHYDGIEINGGHDISIIHNNIVNDYAQTSAIMVNNYFTGVENIVVEGNRLVGGGYTVYVDGRFGGGDVLDSTIKIINNEIGGGYWGNFAFYDHDPVVYGNTALGQTPGPVDPGPVDPGPVDPGPVDPGPVDPGPVDPGPVDPEPEDPKPITYRGTERDDVLPQQGAKDSGDDIYLGLGGNDILRGGAGADKLDGGNGSDTASYAGSSAGVNINLQTGTTSGGDATGDELVSIENLIGSSNADVLKGDYRDNILDGGAGADTLSGGGGNDTYILDNARDQVIEASRGGTDVVKVSFSYALGSNVENLVLQGDANINATGNSAVNIITGNGGANTINGGDGNDILSSGGGSDVIIGGRGNDTLDGQSGLDVLTGGSGNDRFVFHESGLSGNSADHITDFGRNDLIVLDVDSGPVGRVSAGSFTIGTRAVDSNDKFIFDRDKDMLYYDADGSGSGGKVLIATFDNGHTVSARDLLLI